MIQLESRIILRVLSDILLKDALSRIYYWFSRVLRNNSSKFLLLMNASFDDFKCLLTLHCKVVNTVF